jgi:hypothetical protein
MEYQTLNTTLGCAKWRRATVGREERQIKVMQVNAARIRKIRDYKRPHTGRAVIIRIWRIANAT